jgi:hypothetical protein
LAAEKGVCPAAVFEPADGYLGGKKGGRACCFVAGTFCEEILAGTYRDKAKDCWDCGFYRLLRREHGAEFSMPGFAAHLLKTDRSLYEHFVEENLEQPHEDRRTRGL